MIIPKTFTEFQSQDEYIECISVFGFSKKNVENNQFYYKGYYSNEDLPCSIIGYATSQTLVIKIKDIEELHCINGFYLKDMQKNDFNIKDVL